MRRIVATLALAASFSATPAFADAPSEEDVAKAKELFVEAVKLYKAGKHAQALTKFQKSYELRPHWKLHLNIGLCFKELSMYTEAKEEYEAFVKEGKDGLSEDEREVVKGELEELASTIAVLDIEVVNHGARVRLDGKDVGLAPLTGPVEVNPGAHVLEVVMEGHRIYHEEFLLSKGESKEFSITLEALPTGELPPPPPPAGEVEGKTRGKAAPAFWAMGGLALALAGGATAMGVITIKKKNELDDLDAEQQDLYDSGGYTEDGHARYIDDRGKIQDDGKLFGMLTTIFMAAAGAALVGTVVAGVLTHPFAPRQEKPASGSEPGVALKLAPVPLPDGGMLVVAGAF
jgi:tetratricopeptide (TPR) repeat protein